MEPPEPQLTADSGFAAWWRGGQPAGCAACSPVASGGAARDDPLTAPQGNSLGARDWKKCGRDSGPTPALQEYGAESCGEVSRTSEASGSEVASALDFNASTFRPAPQPCSDATVAGQTGAESACTGSSSAGPPGPSPPATSSPLQRQLEQQRQETPAPHLPAPPMSVAPCELHHPGYSPHGYLRRPYAMQLAWAAAVWRATGQFPYPAVRQLRPPMLREGDVYDTALADVEALLPELLLDVQSPLAVPQLAASEVGSAAGPDGVVRRCHQQRPAASDHDLTDGPALAATEHDPKMTTPPATQLAACGSNTDAPAATGVAAAAAAAQRAHDGAGGVGAGWRFPSAHPAAVLPSDGGVGGACEAAYCRPSAASWTALVRLLLHASAVYLLLGFRLTAGSATRLVALPSLRGCWGAFERRHAPPDNPSVLTVGARALTKHTHRDMSGEWWPRMSGSEAVKNQLARESLSRLLGGALWLNVHQLPPFDAPKYVLEVRNLKGYGARWAIEVRSEAAAAAATAAAAAAADGQRHLPRPSEAEPSGGALAEAAVEVEAVPAAPPAPAPVEAAPAAPPAEAVASAPWVPQRAALSHVAAAAAALSLATAQDPSVTGAEHASQVAEEVAVPVPAAAAAVAAVFKGAAVAAAANKPAAAATVVEAKRWAATGATAEVAAEAARAADSGAKPAAATEAELTTTAEVGGAVETQAEVAVSMVAAAVVKKPAATQMTGRSQVQFRGFLEPQMEGGHEAGWRH